MDVKYLMLNRSSYEEALGLLLIWLDTLEIKEYIEELEKQSWDKDEGI